MTTTDLQTRKNRLSYRIGGYSFGGFIIGLVLFILGMLLIRFLGNDHVIPLGLIGLGIVIFVLGVLAEILTFIVAITE
ncbi:MAG: hypothetical protein ACXACX_07595 [Candidatus Hodarchaeales archaeon]|jgi:hypothetical protein